MLAAGRHHVHLGRLPRKYRIGWITYIISLFMIRLFVYYTSMSFERNSASAGHTHTLGGKIFLRLHILQYIRVCLNLYSKLYLFVDPRIFYAATEGPASSAVAAGMGCTERAKGAPKEAALARKKFTLAATTSGESLSKMNCWNRGPTMVRA